MIVIAPRNMHLDIINYYRKDNPLFDIKVIDINDIMEKQEMNRHGKRLHEPAQQGYPGVRWHSHLADAGRQRGVGPRPAPDDAVNDERVVAATSAESGQTLFVGDL